MDFGINFPPKKTASREIHVPSCPAAILAKLSLTKSGLGYSYALLRTCAMARGSVSMSLAPPTNPWYMNASPCSCAQPAMRFVFSWSCKAARLPMKKEGLGGPRRRRRGERCCLTRMRRRPDAAHRKRAIGRVMQSSIGCSQIQFASKFVNVESRVRAVLTWSLPWVCEGSIVIQKERRFRCHCWPAAFMCVYYDILMMMKEEAGCAEREEDLERASSLYGVQPAGHDGQRRRPRGFGIRVMNTISVNSALHHKLYL